MLNAKWYLVCDIRKKIATDFIQIEETWGSATGLLEQSDENLEHFYQWAMLHPNTSFMSIERAVDYGIQQDTIDAVLLQTKSAVLAWLRQMRDPILKASDAIVVPDRWNSLDVVDQNYVKVFRQALRDITNGDDPFHPKWPTIPNALEFLRKTDISEVVRPSEGFLRMLTDPAPPLTLAERQTNQCTRIKAERDRRKAGGVQVNVGGKGYWFHTDDPTRNQYSLLSGIVTRHGLPDDYELQAAWRTMTGEYVSFTVGLLYDIIEAGADIESAVFNHAKAFQEQVITMDDPESLNFHEGWPQSYADYAATLSLSK